MHKAKQSNSQGRQTTHSHTYTHTHGRQGDTHLGMVGGREENRLYLPSQQREGNLCYRC